LGLAVVVLLVGCARRPTAELEQPRLLWPPPPDPARIEYVRSFSVPRDLGIRKNWFVRAMRRLARGRAVHGMARPYAVTVTPDGSIVVADPDARSVHLFDIGRSRYRRLTHAAGAELLSPVGLAADGVGRIYVADSRRQAVFRFGADGKWLDTVGADEKLLRPTGMAYDRDGETLYVVDTLGHRVVGFDGEGRKVVDLGGRGEQPGKFNYPVAVAVGPARQIYVTDSMNFRVQVFDPSGHVAGVFGTAGDGPGEFDKAKGIAVDSDGHIYVVEGLHDAVQIFDPAGRLLSVVGGSGSEPGRFWLPSGIHIGDEGRILIADSANRRIQVLRYLGRPDAEAVSQ
jgi:DNA-binding beta-propeller fold protein YncE